MGLHLCFRHKWLVRARHLQPGTGVSSQWWWWIPGTLTSPGFCHCWDHRYRLWVTLLEKVKNLNLINYLTFWAEEEPWGKKSFWPVPSLIFSETGAVQEQAVGTTLCVREFVIQTWAVLLSDHHKWLLCCVQNISKTLILPKDSFGKQISLLLNLRNWKCFSAGDRVLCEWLQSSA